MGESIKLSSPFYFCPGPYGSKFLFLWMFLLAGFSSFGQGGSFININVGLDQIAHRDQGMSPLMYSGNGFMSELTWSGEGENRTFQFSLSFAKGFQQNKYGNSISYHRGSAQAFVFYHGGKPKKIAWGWFNNNAFSHRYNAGFVNFRDHYEYFTNFGPALRFNNPFMFKGRDLTFEAVGFVQLIGFTIRPSYTSSFPEGFLREQKSIVGGLWDSAKLYHPGNAWNFGFRPKLQYALNSGNRLSIGYQYELYRLNATNPVTQSRGTWYFSISTRL